jgi:hypothetical protein
MRASTNPEVAAAKPSSHRSFPRRRSVTPIVEVLDDRTLLAAGFTAAAAEYGTGTGTVVQVEVYILSVDSSNRAVVSLQNGAMPSEIPGSLNANIEQVSAVGIGSSVFLFALNSSGTVYENTISFSASAPDGSWSGWGRVATGTDGAVSISALDYNGNVGVFQINGAANVYFDTYVSGGWSGWVHVSSNSTDGAASLAPTTSGTEPALFMVNGDGDLYYDVYSGTSWSGWHTVATGIGAAQVTAATYDGAPAVFIANTLGNVYWYYQTSTSPTWSSASQLGSIDATQIVATSFDYNGEGGAYVPVIAALTSTGAVESDIFAPGVGWTGWNTLVSSATNIAIIPFSSGSYNIATQL